MPKKVGKVRNNMKNIIKNTVDKKMAIKDLKLEVSDRKRSGETENVERQKRQHSSLKARYCN